jgi:hypothetical protein
MKIVDPTTQVASKSTLTLENAAGLVCGASATMIIRFLIGIFETAEPCRAAIFLDRPC